MKEDRDYRNAISKTKDPLYYAISPNLMKIAASEKSIGSEDGTFSSYERKGELVQ